MDNILHLDYNFSNVGTNNEMGKDVLYHLFLLQVPQFMPTTYVEILIL